MRICESCATENSEDAIICKECGEQLSEKNSNIQRKSSSPFKKIILILSVIVIIAFGIYFTNSPTDVPIEVETPQILIDKIIITEIERDWLENNTWQVSTTIYFNIINPNSFDVNFTNINFSVDLLDRNIFSRIYDGSSKEHIVKSNGELKINESFWFLSDDDGVDNLKSENLNYKVQGTAFFNVKSSSLTQYGSFQFNGEV